jgi:hypothetical protein
METTNLTLNRSQGLVHIVNPNVAACLWPRAGGKTTGGQGPRVVHLSETMQRSQVILFSDTFERIHDRIVPNILTFVENEMGLVEGQDYVSFKAPPDHFERPLIKLNKHDHVVSFASGFRLCCASQKVSGSANGYNAQALIVDETKFVKHGTITTEVLPALRGAKKYFGHLPEYRSQWYFTDKWGGDIGWLLRLRQHVKPQLIKAVISMQLKIYELQNKMEEYTSTATQYQYKNQIIEIENKLQRIRREMIYVSDAEPYENIKNLGEKYYRDIRRDMSALEFEIAILNRDPDKVEHSFYPAYVPIKHDYHVNTSEDIQMNKAITVALDYQWRIVPLVAGQMGQLPGQEYETMNVITQAHSLYEDDGSIDKTVHNFCELMKSLGYSYNVVNYIYDHTAVAKSPASKPFYLIVEEAFNSRGWNVNMVNIGKASEHALRFASIKNMFLKEGDHALRFNYNRTPDLRKSLQLAGAVSSGGKTKKDKSKEKNLAIPATETTDYSEAFDQLVWGMLELKMVPDSYDIGLSIATR